MNGTLGADAYRRLLSIVETAGRQAGSPDFRSAVLDALDEHLGYRGSAFFIAGPPVPGFQALDGVLHGYAERGLEEYATNWSSREPFGRAVPLAHLRRGRPVAFEEIVQRGDAEHRDYVDLWLRPQRIEGYMLTWLDTGLPGHGYLSILSDREFGPRDRALLTALRPHLQAFLRRSLPQTGGLGRLSSRELEVARLIAAGHVNRDIARRLGVREDTVKKHVSRALTKLHLRRRTQLALALGIAPGDSTFVQ